MYGEVCTALPPTLTISLTFTRNTCNYTSITRTDICKNMFSWKREVMVLAFLSPVLWYRKMSIQPWNPFWCAFLKSSTWVWQLLQSSPSIPQSFNHSKADSFLQHPLCLALDCLSTSPQSLPVWQKHQTLNVLLHTSLFNDKFRQGSCLHTIQRRTEIPDRFRNAISFSCQTNISSCTFFLFSSVFFLQLSQSHISNWYLLDWSSVNS